MELWKEILVKVLENSGVHVAVPSLQLSVAEIIEKESYRALCKINDIIKDDALSDTECFEQIEQIVSVFEEMGADTGGRHDFG